MTTYKPTNPLIVQSDHTVLVEVDSPRYEAARNELVRFAELVKSPEHIHTYRITPLSIWNARAAGISAAEISEGLYRFSKYQVPEHVLVEINDFASRFGRLQGVDEKAIQGGVDTQGKRQVRQVPVNIGSLAVIGGVKVLHDLLEVAPGPRALVINLGHMGQIVGVDDEWVIFQLVRRLVRQSIGRI
jgi:hypothetical protein